MSPSDDSTRPISVAELLARNGTIGAPPVGGRRRRRRGNDQAVTVAELTGEMQAIRVEQIQAVEVVEVVEVVEAVEAVEVVEVVEEAPESSEAVVIYPDYSDAVDYTDRVVEEAPERAEHPTPEIPPLSSPPWTRRKKGPELSHDPRPARRPSGAEQMTYDPVDQSVDLADLVDNQTDDAEELRSYLRSSGGTLFSGETVADDLARRGIGGADQPAETGAVTATGARRSEGRLTALRHAAVAMLQSVLAVIFGAGLFIAFDQLWRWNNIVALVLSVLVILGLVIAVRVVRKTEDIASTLIAVAVGALVTLGPLALLQST